MNDPPRILIVDDNETTSCGSAAFDCVGLAVPSLSSRWRRSPRTCADWPSSSLGRHR
jgi:hypothetical protein